MFFCHRCKRAELDYITSQFTMDAISYHDCCKARRHGLPSRRRLEDASNNTRTCNESHEGQDAKATSGVASEACIIINLHALEIIIWIPSIA